MKMKNKLKKFLGVITAISLSLQMSFVITAGAAIQTVRLTSISNLPTQTAAEQETRTTPSALMHRQQRITSRLLNLISI